LFVAELISSTVRNLIVLHFLKRFYESAFMHTFSRPTVPLAYVFRKYVFSLSPDVG
jgi:very-long-chain enoyl-CoA reductase